MIEERKTRRKEGREGVRKDKLVGRRSKNRGNNIEVCVVCKEKSSSLLTIHTNKNTLSSI
jgi:hypothetical protein